MLSLLNFPFIRLRILHIFKVLYWIKCSILITYYINDVFILHILFVNIVFYLSLNSFAVLIEMVCPAKWVGWGDTAKVLKLFYIIIFRTSYRVFNAPTHTPHPPIFLFPLFSSMSYIYLSQVPLDVILLLLLFIIIITIIIIIIIIILLRNIKKIRT